jgi:hypothetical protein
MLTDKPTGKRPFGRNRRRWEDNTIIDFNEISINVRNWTDTTLDSDYLRALVNAALNLHVS